VTRGLIVSVGLHVGIFAAAWLGPRPKPFEWDPQKPHVVELVASAVEIPAPKDPVRRPAPKETPRLSAPVTEPVTEAPPEKAPPPEDKPKPEPTPVRPRPQPERPPRTFQRVAPKRTDEGPSLEQRLQQRLEEVEADEAASTAPSPAPTPPQEAAPHSASAEVEALDFPFAWYLKQVQTRVRDSWDTPGDRLLAGGARPVVVSFVIHRDGHVSDVRVDSPSGTPGLDASALRAVDRAQPFPPLPDPYEGSSLSLTIRFRVSGGGS
jgi:TonB family protein